MSSDRTTEELLQAYFPHLTPPEYKSTPTGSSVKFLNFEISTSHKICGEDKTPLSSIVADVLSRLHRGIREEHENIQIKRESDYLNAEKAMIKSLQSKEMVKRQVTEKIYHKDRGLNTGERPALVNSSSDMKTSSHVKIIQESTASLKSDSEQDLGEAVPQNLDFLNGTDYKTLITEPIKSKCSTVEEESSEIYDCPTPGYYEEESPIHEVSLSSIICSPKLVQADSKMVGSAGVSNDAINLSGTYLTEVYEMAPQIGYVDALRRVCRYYRFEFPEFELLRENCVFVCTAIFMQATFTSPYVFEKETAKEGAARSVLEYIHEKWDYLMKDR